MNQNWERWGRDIRNIVQNAIDSQDFRRLNDTIANTVNDAVFQFKESVRQTGEGFRQAALILRKAVRISGGMDRNTAGRIQSPALFLPAIKE